MGDEYWDIRISSCREYIGTCREALNILNDDKKKYESFGNVLVSVKLSLENISEAMKNTKSCFDKGAYDDGREVSFSDVSQNIINDIDDSLTIINAVTLGLNGLYDDFSAVSTYINDRIRGLKRDIAYYNRKKENGA